MAVEGQASLKPRLRWPAHPAKLPCWGPGIWYGDLACGQASNIARGTRCRRFVVDRRRTRMLESSSARWRQVRGVHSPPYALSRRSVEASKQTFPILVILVTSLRHDIAASGWE